MIALLFKYLRINIHLILNFYFIKSGIEWQRYSLCNLMKLLLNLNVWIEWIYNAMRQLTDLFGFLEFILFHIFFLNWCDKYFRLIDLNIISRLLSLYHLTREFWAFYFRFLKDFILIYLFFLFAWRILIAIFVNGLKLSSLCLQIILLKSCLLFIFF